jgi:major outer membrane protein
MPILGTSSCFRTHSLRTRLLGATSFLCLALALSDAVQAQPYGSERPGYYDRFFVSFEGGYLFNGSKDNLDFNQTSFLSGLPPLQPGRNGGMFGVSFGRPINPAWDWMLGWRYNALGTDRASTSENFASDKFWYQHFDLEFGYRPPTMGPVDVRLFAGLRVLNAQNRIRYGYDTDKLGFDKLGNFDHKIDLWGVGPRGGIQATVPLGLSPAFLSLSGAGSAIFSRVNHQYNFSFLMENPGPPTTGAGFSTTTSSRTVYNLEASVAIGFRVSPTTTFQIGYQAQQWWNLATKMGAANDVGGFEPSRSNVLSHGLVAKITFALP